MNIIIRFCIYALSLSSSLVFAERPTVEQIIAARHIIGECLTKFQKVCESRTVLEKRTQSIFISKRRHMRHAVDLMIFDRYLDDFTKLQADERQVMTAKTGEKMRELAVAYSSNCSRAAEGILALVDFSLGKPIDKDLTRTFRRERKTLIAQSLATTEQGRDVEIGLK